MLVEIDRPQFNELAEKGTIKSYRKAVETGHIKASGDSNVLKLIAQVVERQEERRETAEKCTERAEADADAVKRPGPSTGSQAARLPVARRTEAARHLHRAPRPGRNARRRADHAESPGA